MVEGGGEGTEDIGLTRQLGGTPGRKEEGGGGGGRRGGEGGRGRKRGILVVTWLGV